MKNEVNIKQAAAYNGTGTIVDFYFGQSGPKLRILPKAPTEHKCSLNQFICLFCLKQRDIVLHHGELQTEYFYQCNHGN